MPIVDVGDGDQINVEVFRTIENRAPRGIRQGEERKGQFWPGMPRTQMLVANALAKLRISEVKSSLRRRTPVKSHGPTSCFSLPSQAGNRPLAEVMPAG